MVSYLRRLLKRFAVLIPGIIIVYISARDVFPYFDKRLPLVIAIFVTYLIGAYLLIPALTRLWRLAIPAKHLPLYCVTPDGLASDPLNIGFIGTRKQLITAMMDAGWTLTDPRTPRTMAMALLSIILSRDYHGAPVSTLYLFGRKQDIGFELSQKQKGRGYRHHVRFWSTTFDDIDSLSTNTIHWQKRPQRVTGDQLLWVGAASKDIGITFVKHTFQLTHMVAPDTDSERALIIRQLTKRRLAKPVTTIRLDAPYRLINRAWRGWRGYLQTDGQMSILELEN